MQRVSGGLSVAWVCCWMVGVARCDRLGVKNSQPPPKCQREEDSDVGMFLNAYVASGGSENLVSRVCRLNCSKLKTVGSVASPDVQMAGEERSGHH